MALMRFDPFRETGCITAQVMAGNRVPGTSGRVQRVSSHREADEIPIAEASNPHRIFLNQRGSRASAGPPPPTRTGSSGLRQSVPRWQPPPKEANE